jgi:HEAT repeat protein
MSNTVRCNIQQITTLFLLTIMGTVAGLAAQEAESVSISTAKVQALVTQGNTPALKALGKNVLPVLVRMYKSSNEDQRTHIAHTLYVLGWKSPEAKKVLMADVHTKNQDLRFQVQYALGRVSDDRDVVEVLLDNMQNDANPVFRDKAACALAYDQIHLTEQQKVRLYEGLINALSDSKVDVRSIARLALRIQTGQTKRFKATGTSTERELAVREWNKWLEEYRSRW